MTWTLHVLHMEFQTQVAMHEDSVGFQVGSGQLHKVLPWAFYSFRPMRSWETSVISCFVLPKAAKPLSAPWNKRSACLQHRTLCGLATTSLKFSLPFQLDQLEHTQQHYPNACLPARRNPATGNRQPCSPPSQDQLTSKYFQ